MNKTTTPSDGKVHPDAEIRVDTLMAIIDKAFNVYITVTREAKTRFSKTHPRAEAVCEGRIAGAEALKISIEHNIERLLRENQNTNKVQEK